MILKHHLVLTLCAVYGILLKVTAQKSTLRGSSGQQPLVQNQTVTEGGTANMTCRVEYNDQTSLQWSNPAQQTLFFGDKKALRDNRIELVRASWSELTISISEVTLADEGMYTCSLFTMPVKTAKAYLTVLGVPEMPEIDGLTKPALEGDEITLTCMTHGSKPAADLRWFRNEKEIKGQDTVLLGQRLEVRDVPSTLPPSTTPPPRPTPPDTTAPLDPHLASSDPPNTNNRDPNAMGQHGPDHALIGGVVAVVVFVTLCLIIVLGRYLARHKGTYLTNEAKGADDAPDADTAIINAEGNTHAEEKKEYFI
ncbi:cell adhesion molecule 2-like [Oncorhynchus masou masou]|uniref:cell adhesion molecule 2-like n=1 Tax=Oncorhynchus masou masou TaxID=90313 RepID=UPI0031835252